MTEEYKKWQTALEFIESTRAITDTRILTGRFQDLIQSYGLTYFRAGDCTTPKLDVERGAVVATWPQEWVDRWLSRNYVTIDPVVTEACSSSQTFTWHDVKTRASPTGARVIDEGRDFRMNDGFGFGAHTTDGRTDVMIAGCEYFELGPREEACLHMAGIYFLSRLRELQPAPKPEVIELTPRERECLSWVAAGKSDWEISVILGISENTARWYVAKAMEKLQVRTRPHAVTVGLMRHLISV